MQDDWRKFVVLVSLLLTFKTNDYGSKTRRYIGIRESEYRATYDSITFNMTKNGPANKVHRQVS